MKKYIKILILWLLAFGVCSCASMPLAPPEWVYEKEAIRLHLKADFQLNLHAGTPHTLLMCVYQLRNPNTFNQLAGDNNGIYKLLECGLFDDSVVGTERLIIHPGQDLTFTLNRAEGAKYVAIVAGYYLLRKERIIRLFDIPVIVERKGWNKLTKILRPGPLNIELRLGQQQIKER